MIYLNLSDSKAVRQVFRIWGKRRKVLLRAQERNYRSRIGLKAIQIDCPQVANNMTGGIHFELREK